MDYKKVQNMLNLRNIEFRKQINKMAQEHSNALNISQNKDEIINELRNQVNNLINISQNKDLMINELNEQLNFLSNKHSNVINLSQNKDVMIDESNKVDIITNNYQNYKLPNIF